MYFNDLSGWFPVHLALATTKIIFHVSKGECTCQHLLQLYADPLAANLEPQRLEDAKLRYVKNSGVCETTPGVNQLSGYIDVGTNMSMVRNPYEHVLH